MNDLWGPNYWGKTFYAQGGNSVLNRPLQAGGFALQIHRGGNGLTVQNYIFNTTSNTVTVYNRTDMGTNGVSWSDWEEIVTSDGSYPTLGAGYLQGFTTSTTSSTGGKGWVHFAKIDGTKISRSYSLILLISGRHFVGTAGSAAPSGLLEIESYVDPTAHTFNTTTGTNIKILAGEITPNDFCFVNNGTSLDLYIYFGDVNGNSYITKLSETATGTNSGEAFVTTAVTTDNTFYGTTAPANAVYAVVRNNASADDTGYSFDTNYVWHNNGQAEVNTLKDGTTSLDFNDYLEEGKYELQGNADNTAVNFPTSSLNPSATNCDWYLVVYRRSLTYITQVAYSVRADGSIAIRTLNNGTWGNWQLLFDNGVAQQIPAASQTVLGGVKVYTDSEGYLNIDTQ